jgi:biopolymer transport protein ExbB
MNPMLANIVFEFFCKGGPVMWPILASAVVAVAVVGERTFWWLRESRHRDPKQLEQLLAALENGDVAAAKTVSAGSEDAVIRMIRHGLNHVGGVHSSLLGALQLAAGIELKRAGRFLTVMDTLVTLAPLLGLLGTVTGLMRAFLNIGSAELSVSAVTGGIGEALIATACGLSIAIFALIPFNYFSAKVTQLQFDLETAATNVEVMVSGGKGGDTVHLHQPASSGQSTSTKATGETQIESSGKVLGARAETR